MYIIAGLGNPGRKYAHTRHNVGFDAVDRLAEDCRISMEGKKFQGIYGIGYIGGQKAVLVKPQTYMNLSGECIRDFLYYYRVDPEQELLVLFDDISLEPGNIRIRKKGSAGGHNGIKNIILHAGTQNFARIKIGVGEKPSSWDLADYVLSPFSRQDRELVDGALDHAADAVKMILEGSMEAAMNQYNRKREAPSPQAEGRRTGE